MKRRLLTMLAVVAMLTICVVAAYAASETPASLEGIKNVDADAVKKSLDSGENMVILDPRKASDFTDKGHIPTSLNCPVGTETDVTDASVDKTVEHLKQCPDLMKVSKDQKIVAYCNGVTCWMSPKAMLALKKLGYKNLHWFRGGIVEWQAKGYPTE